ncbi:hypothetical protein DWZ50_08915 [Mediterraneibacter gnavus]|uniref:Uncharacterized protein n=1 Tax=Mediterraneibacter gnavus TaxID=33038 RepID=A0A415S9M6_MEDGN|nr:hypothetical protein DWZ50_08915 [Mediterraneibacter gnavus]
MHINRHSSIKKNFERKSQKAQKPRNAVRQTQEKGGFIKINMARYSAIAFIPEMNMTAEPI